MDQIPADVADSDEAEVIASDLIEEVSIDGMCGVY
jgi:mycofactocin precursor